MSDKNIKIIEHIQKYGHPLQGDKMTDQSYYNQDEVGVYPPTTRLEPMPPNYRSSIMVPKPKSESEIELATLQRVFRVIRDLQLKSEFPTPEEWANFFKSFDLVQKIKDEFGMED